MNKNLVLITLAVCFLLVFFLKPVLSNLSCEVTTNCLYTGVFHISNQTNAHAELNNNTNYDYKICCRDTENETTLETGCSGIYETLLKLSNETNAHVEEKTQSNYNFPVCLNVSTTIYCNYATSCFGYDTCVASISGVTNAHVADCVTNPYSIKICCGFTKRGNVSGIVLDFYTGERINGTITIIPVEDPEHTMIAEVVNGQWTIDFNMDVGEVEHLTFIVNDSDSLGYTQLKLVNPNPAQTPSCTQQNISLKGYGIDVNTGQVLTDITLRITILETHYTTTSTISGPIGSIELNPCLVSGKLYTLEITVIDSSGNQRGKYYITYSAK